MSRTVFSLTPYIRATATAEGRIPDSTLALPGIVLGNEKRKIAATSEVDSIARGFGGLANIKLLSAYAANSSNSASPISGTAS